MIPSGTLLLLLWHKFTQIVNRDFLNGDANPSVTGMISISSSHLLRSILLLHKSVPFLSAGSNLASIRDELKRIKGKTVVKLLKNNKQFWKLIYLFAFFFKGDREGDKGESLAFSVHNKKPVVLLAKFCDDVALPPFPLSLIIFLMAQINAIIFKASLGWQCHLKKIN